ncbi:xanthine dehydrogenase family protein molybdopterin-binding subunit [Marinimicrococcus flavescens]|uniref:Xanthine dehydrogenase family protein molybdopterin-binding subunit n=1 Tax=Marinimicrococcus flavescens TaxID=3031815 RepID=A0AAP3XQT4_9PROT|nr:xanthine dehydrogenase family protein molybdopterin-binding subunit [Marinimicrococcus flavescens]
MSSEENPFGMGRSVRRREDARLIRGRGRYVDDLGEAGDRHAVFVRSAHAHARILAIDTAGALAAPGVEAVFTGRDLRDAGVGSIPCGWRILNKDGSPMAEPPHYPLCVDRVRHVGDPVAVVIAATRGQARDAAELVAVEYEELPAAAATARARDPGAPQIWAEAPGNLCCDWEIGDRQAAEAALAAAEHVVEIELVNNRLVANPMEPRAARAALDPSSGRCTLWTTTQNPHTVKSMLCNQVLGIPDHELRVIGPDVGGGFGTKIFLYPEESVVTWAARRLGGAIRWTADRSEGFLTDAQGRDHVTAARLGLDGEGRFLGLAVSTTANVGAYLSQGATAIPTFYYAQLLSGVYRIPAIWCEVAVVFTNTACVDAYRGAGRPEATYVLERLVDAAARRLGLDRAEIRRRNFIPADAFPYATPLGLTYDSGDHEGTLALALEAVDYQGFEARRAESAARGRLRGIGLSTYVEIAGGVPSRLVAQLGARGARYEAAEVRVQPSGHVTVFCGTHSQGQGHETTFPQLVSEKLGIPYETVTLVQGDTDQVLYGRGTAASRSLVVGGSAILRALDKVIEKGRRIASHVLEAAAEDIVFAGGAYAVGGTDRSVSFAEIARRAYAAVDFPPDEIEPGLNETAFYDPANWTYPGGCHACELEVDPETGVVTLLRIVAADDVGRVLNPMIVEGQIQGGLAQGVGQALLENCVYEEGTAQLLTGSFMDYAMPRADDMPEFEVLTHEVVCAHNPVGAKGCAEVGSVGLPPAIINAVLDALAPLGVTHLDMPATPERVWQAIRAAAGGPA